MGGVERRFIEVSKIMRRMNVSIYALEFYPSVKRFVDTGYVSYEINRPFPNTFLESICAVSQTLKLGIAIRRAKKYQLVVITGHRYVTFTLISAYLLAKLLGVPWVIVSGGLLPRERMSLRTLIRERRKRGFSFLAAFAYTVGDWFKKQLFRRASAFIAVSQSEKREVIRFLGVPDAQIHVVGNGVNLELIDSIPEKGKKFDAVFVGRVEPGKGLRTLISSWAKVVERIPSARLIIVGEGRLSYYRQLSELKKLSKNVQFVGFTPSEQTLAFMKQSKMFLFPSKRESFPLSLLEAMACGLPCIASDLQPLRENFKKGIIFVQPGDIEAFAEAATNLLNHEDERKALGTQARGYAQMFSWENVVRREMEILTKTLDDLH